MKLGIGFQRVLTNEPLERALSGFLREAVIRAAVESGHKALHHRAGAQFQRTDGHERRGVDDPPRARRRHWSRGGHAAADSMRR